MGTIQGSGSTPAAQSPGHGGGICGADYRAYDPQEPPGKILQSSQLKASGTLP